MVLNRQFMAGAVTLLMAGFAIVQPSQSYPVPSESLLSQVNVPPEEGVPQLTSEEVQGRITRIQGDRVEMQLSNGETRTYTISADDQTRNQLRVGSDVVLSVRGDTVLAINPSSGSTSGTTSSSQSSGSTSSTSGSSSTVIRRQTTGQQTTPAPTTSQSQTAPQTTQQEPQPVRGLW